MIQQGARPPWGASAHSEECPHSWQGSAGHVCWPTASVRAFGVKVVRSCLALKRLLQEAAPPAPPHTRGQTKAAPHPHPAATKLSRAGHCHQLSGCPTAGRGCPAHAGHTGGPAFRNVSFGGTPALLDCGADGPSFWDPGAASPEAGPASVARRPATALGHNSPTSAPSSHLLEGRPLCPSECTAN